MSQQQGPSQRAAMVVEHPIAPHSLNVYRLNGTQTIPCRVCKNLIPYDSSKTMQHVIRCPSCNEATPTGRKFVRCPCNCLLICQIMFATITLIAALFLAIGIFFGLQDEESSYRKEKFFSEFFLKSDISLTCLAMAVMIVSAFYFGELAAARFNSRDAGDLVVSSLLFIAFARLCFMLSLLAGILLAAFALCGCLVLEWTDFGDWCGRHWARLERSINHAWNYQPKRCDLHEHVHDLVEEFENQAVIEQEAAEAEEVHHPDTDSVHTAEPPEEVKTAETNEEVTTARLPDTLHELKREQKMPSTDFELEKTVLKEDDLKTDGEKLPTAVEDVPTAVENPKAAVDELPTAVEEPQSPVDDLKTAVSPRGSLVMRIETTALERPPPPADVSAVNSTVGSEAKPKKKKSSFRRGLGLPRRLSLSLKERVFGHKEPKPPVVHVETEVKAIDGSLRDVPMDNATPSTSGLRPVLLPSPRPPVPSGSQQAN